MNASRIIRSSLLFYWRTHAGVLLGVMIATTVLTGSLLVGDSVQATLRHHAFLRIGRADEAMFSGDRFVREALAAATDAAPALLVRGSVTRADASSRANVVQVLGVNHRFWELSPGGQSRQLAAGDLAVNARLARQLGVAENDTVILRVEKPSAFSRDAPLSGEENEVLAIRGRVAALIDDSAFGRFSLQASQIPSATVFLDLAFLQEKLQLASRANLLLKKNGSGEGDDRKSSASGFAGAIEKEWTLEDAAIEFRPTPPGGFELRTSRVFLPPEMVKAAPRGTDALTYLVNEIRAGERAVPYSMVTAIDAPSSGFLPAELAANEIVINEWLADDLGIREGGVVKLSYFVMGERRRLEERSREFTVLAIVPMSEPQLNDSWMPDFPGLKDAENCREWEPGFAMDLTKIREKDEEYWDQFRGTPKAFVNITVGQEMWSNRWGELTAIRYRADHDQNLIAAQMRERLSAAQIGINIVALRDDALAATRAPVDFGQLFASFSFFLIVSAAVLTALLFVFSIEQRQEQAGLLLAIGWPARRVARLFRLEGAGLAVLGSILGVALALLYTLGVLRGLATVWRGAVGTGDFVFAPSASSIVVGLCSGTVLALAAMWLASRRQFQRSARELLSGSVDPVPGRRSIANTSLERQIPHQRGRGLTPLVLALVALLGAGGLAVFARGAGAFFGAGALLLCAGYLGAYWRLRGAADSNSTLQTLNELALRNAARRRGRSMATVAVLSSGVFVVLAVDSFRQPPPAPTAERASGTGGFMLVAESALPVYDDLNSAAGRNAFALDERIMQPVQIVPLRMREGDDASCLNLNRALQPRVLGVEPGELARRKAFVAPGGGPVSWELLDQSAEDDVVPAIVDQATLQWALQKKIGDTLEYRDDQGAPFKIRLAATVAGSILQGQLLISERQFIRRFANHAGYRYFLIDAPVAAADAVATHLSRALQDRGLEIVPAWRRLAEFQEVQNTYLSIFQVLGGLGWLLGTAGLGIIVARNVLERRREFGLLEAVGFRQRQLRRLVFAEQRWLIVFALAIGAVSAFVAIWPGLRERAGSVPIGAMALLFLGLALGSAFWTWLSARLALRGDVLNALRSE